MERPRKLDCCIGERRVEIARSKPCAVHQDIGQRRVKARLDHAIRNAVAIDVRKTALLKSRSVARRIRIKGGHTANAAPGIKRDRRREN